MTAVVGRGRELTRVDDLLAGAAARRGGGVLLVGATGSGRSTLVASAEERARERGFEVRRATGRTTETDIAGAVISELLDDHDATPTTVLARLAALAEAIPVLVAVDDLHLADPASASALFYAARRVARLPIAVVLAVASGTAPTDRSGLQTLELDGLDERGIAELFDQVAGSITPSVAERVRELTGGNPLAVLELARTSSVDQRAGTAPFPDLPALSEVAVRAFAGPLLELPDATRRAACVAAAEPTGRVDRVATALGLLGDHLDALAPAEEAGVVRIDGGRLHFDHPMRRVVAYALLAAPSRRAAHRALAAAWAEPSDAAHRLAHMVAGTAGPDAAIADDAAALAEHLERTGAADAADAWRTAARLTPDDQLATARRARADAVARPELPASPATGPLAVLSPAERRVAAVVGEGLSNRQTAERLYLSLKTVDAHLQAIFRKLDIRSRAQLAVLVTREGALG